MTAGAELRFFKAIGWPALFVFIGLVGSLAILIGATALIATQSPVSLPSGVFVYTDAWDRGYVYATGTWTMENSRQAFPIQTSKIRCIREEHYPPHEFPKPLLRYMPFKKSCRINKPKVAPLAEAINSKQRVQRCCTALTGDLTKCVLAVSNNLKSEAI